MNHDHDLDRLEHQIGRVLTIGVWISALTLAAGLLMRFLALPRASTVLNAGLVLLMCIPVTRIVTSFGDAIRRRDRLLAWSTGTVLTVLVILLFVVRQMK